MVHKFSKNDTVVYGKNGICIVEDIKAMSFGGDSEPYYVLRPKSNRGSTLYVPLGKENLVSRMRKLLTKKEIDAILEKRDGIGIEWCDNKTERNSIFSDILSGCDTAKLLKMIKCLRDKKEEKQSRGKKLSPSDEGLLKVSEKLICEEFSYVLGCDPEEVGAYILKKVNG